MYDFVWEILDISSDFCQVACSHQLYIYIFRLFISHVIYIILVVKKLIKKNGIMMPT